MQPNKVTLNSHKKYWKTIICYLNDVKNAKIDMKDETWKELKLKYYKFKNQKNSNTLQ